jgi:hypothetical protein
MKTQVRPLIQGELKLRTGGEKKTVRRNRVIIELQKDKNGFYFLVCYSNSSLLLPYRNGSM